MPIKGGKPTEKQLSALRENQKRFKQGEARTKDFGSIGGKKSGEIRKEASQARTFAAILAEELNIINERTGQPRKNGVAKKLVEAMEKAKPKEAAKLFEVLRDTLGEAPAQKIDINANVKTIGNWRDVPKSTTENENNSPDTTDTADTNEKEKKSEECGGKVEEEKREEDSNT